MANMIDLLSISIKESRREIGDGKGNGVLGIRTSKGISRTLSVWCESDRKAKVYILAILQGGD
jgi:hypothetical protein